MGWALNYRHGVPLPYSALATPHRRSTPLHARAFTWDQISDDAFDSNGPMARSQRSLRFQFAASPAALSPQAE